MGIKLSFISAGKAMLIEHLKTPFGIVPVGFLTDGFTIPWFACWFHTPFGWGLAAAIWHDYALTNRLPHAHRQFLAMLLDTAVNDAKNKLYVVARVLKALVLFIVVVLYAHCKRLIKQ